ncbi:hypothetical protein WA158_006324 [Blastocystis sp. Blastoise]
MDAFTSADSKPMNSGVDEVSIDWETQIAMLSKRKQQQIIEEKKHEVEKIQLEEQEQMEAEAAKEKEEQEFNVEKTKKQAKAKEENNKKKEKPQKKEKVKEQSVFAGVFESNKDRKKREKKERELAEIEKKKKRQEEAENIKLVKQEQQRVRKEAQQKQIVETVVIEKKQKKSNTCVNFIGFILTTINFCIVWGTILYFIFELLEQPFTASFAFQVPFVEETVFAREFSSANQNMRMNRSVMNLVKEVIEGKYAYIYHYTHQFSSFFEYANWRADKLMRAVFIKYNPLKQL